MTAHSKLEKTVAKTKTVSNAMHKRKARAALVEIMHPRWSPFEDYRIMKLKAAGSHFTAISLKLKRPTIAVEQRWQRLRVISNILDKLEAFGLTREPYSMGSV